MNDDDYNVDVCSECLCASCWHGTFMCDKSDGAGVVTMRASELRELGREHSDYFSKIRISEVCGPLSIGVA